MVDKREDRLQLRIIECVLLSTAVIAGGILSPGILSGDAGRLLITFLGLVSASILPTISLILGSMTSNSRSVKAINDLQKELSIAMDALFLIFGLIGLAVIALLSLAIPPPAFIERIPYIIIFLPRLGQSIVVATSVLIVMRAGSIPAILHRCLEIRHRIAIEEARRKILETHLTEVRPKHYLPTTPILVSQLQLRKCKIEIQFNWHRGNHDFIKLKR